MSATAAVRPAPRAAAPRPDVPAPPRTGLFAEMIRLWLEHHQRMIDMRAFRL